MLQDLDKTIEKIIVQYGNLSGSDIDISFEQPTREWSSRLSRPAINCFCYDMRENLKLRSMEMNTVRTGNRSRTAFVPRRIDLTYLVTAWARKIEDEHQLLWRALSALKRFTQLQPEECEGALRYQSLPIPFWVADTPGTQPNFVDLWSVLDNQMRLGFAVQATVELDLDKGFESSLVLEAFVRVGEANQPATRSLTGQPEILHIKPKPDDPPKEGDI